MNPKVSFIVPCYKLGHLLAECVHSILGQTYPDFEVLIMDDCSPDNTPEVAGFLEERDRRVRHIRNVPNLGHIANYNKGIGLARGEYVWLISADDSLRKPYVLERYVHLMDNNSNVGYVFCPAIRRVNGVEAGVMESTAPLASDAIVSGHAFLRDFELDSDRVPVVAVMVRKICYQQLSLYPPDLPYCGDWYLWCLFALFHDVGYFAEPMAIRSFHEQNMTHFYCKDGIQIYFDNLMAVPARIKEVAKKEGYDAIIESCDVAAASGYLRLVTPPQSGDTVQASMTVEEFEGALSRSTDEPKTRARVRRYVYAGLGDHYYDRGDAVLALASYHRALRESRGISIVWVKYLLLRMGGAGRFLRGSLSLLKRRIRRNRLAKVWSTLLNTIARILPRLWPSIGSFSKRNQVKGS